jgi:ABC-type nickel/cobalt efflux system permease component RcnA
MAKRVTFSNPFKLFTISIGLFPVKLIVFVIVAFGTLYLIGIDKFFFGFAFMIGTIMTLFVEVIFIVDVNRAAVHKKKHG